MFLQICHPRCLGDPGRSWEIPLEARAKVAHLYQGPVHHLQGPGTRCAGGGSMGIFYDVLWGARLELLKEPKKRLGTQHHHHHVLMLFDPGF